MGLLQGKQDGAVLWYKDYDKDGLHSDSFETDFTVPSGAGVEYSFVFVHKGAIVGMSAPMMSA